MLHIESDKTVNEYKIYSMDGKLILNGKVEKNQIELSELFPGAYIIEFKINDYYLEEKTVDYDEAESKGLETVNKIMSKNLKGDVLFFTITEPASEASKRNAFP